MNVDFFNCNLPGSLTVDFNSNKSSSNGDLVAILSSNPLFANNLTIELPTKPAPPKRQIFLHKLKTCYTISN